ncbi:MAG: aminoacyl-tRNA hydrolase [Deferribacterota bacterium]|nr:aminoacyl-tRNA hydrolase [Deferribacterota bacterium]
MDYFITGLGNKGEKYRYTRHNIGRLVLELLLKELKIYRLSREHFFYTYLFGHKIYLYIPDCYMNESGVYIKRVFSHLDVSVDNMLVIHDDKDIPFGYIKFIKNGSSGGHRGVQSVIDNIGNNFIRLKCGIASRHIYDTADFVLSSFTQEERNDLKSYLEFIIKATFSFIKDGLSKSMSIYNKKYFKDFHGNS